MALGRTCKPKGNFFTMFYFKEIPRGFLLEHTVLFRIGPSQISQQLRLGNQAHAPSQTRFQWNYLCANQFKYQKSRKLYTRHLQSMERATIHHFHHKSLHRFAHIKAGSFIQSMKHSFLCFNLFILFLFLFYFILLLFFEFLNDLNELFFQDTRRKDRSDDIPGYIGTPKLERSSVGLLSWPIFFVCSVKSKECICDNLNMP